MFIWTAEPDSPETDGLADFKSAKVSKCFSGLILSLLPYILELWSHLSHCSFSFCRNNNRSPLDCFDRSRVRALAL